jgi:hypothetical protein
MMRKAIIVVLTLAAVGTACLWALNSLNANLLVEASDGGLSIVVAYDRDPEPPRTTVEYRLGRFALKRSAAHGIALPGGLVPQTVMWTLEMPLWALLVLFAVYPLVGFTRGPVRRWQRSRKGLCLQCGYDLTGNVSGVCPECGEAV